VWVLEHDELDRFVTHYRERIAPLPCSRDDEIRVLLRRRPVWIIKAQSREALGSCAYPSRPVHLEHGSAPDQFWQISDD
jgi:hypothetical protein